MWAIILPFSTSAQPSEGDGFDCSAFAENEFHYQLLPYSEQDRYIFHCSIKPGALRHRYTIEWRSRTVNGRDIHTDTNETNFDVYLSSADLPPLSREQWLECRVEISHDVANNRLYCGTRMKAAGIYYYYYDHMTLSSLGLQ